MLQLNPTYFSCVSADDFPQNLSIVGQNLRLSIGLGLALRLGKMARVELNYCFPVKKQKGDVDNPGVQFGIGVMFL